MNEDLDWVKVEDGAYESSPGVFMFRISADPKTGQYVTKIKRRGESCSISTSFPTLTDAKRYCLMLFKTEEYST